jgi:glycosyltransferase involved in cell wall biosynthesis
MKLSILIPVFNERKTISVIISRILSQELHGIDAREIIIVDDGSNDGSTEIIRNLTQQHVEIRSIYQSKNSGKGTAIRLAIEAAEGDIGIIQDADLEYNPLDFLALLNPILQNNADVVFGTRFTIGTSRRVLYFKHALGNKLITSLSNWFTDLYLTDVLTGYKAFRLKVIKSIPFRSKRFEFEAEFTAKVSKRKLRVYEVPISYHGRTYAEGKKVTWKDGFSSILTILRYYFIDDAFKEDFGHQILMEMQEAPKFVEWSQNLIKPFLGNIVLEVGAGIGRNVQQLLFASDKVIATDYEEKYIDILNNLFANSPDVTICQWDINHSPDTIKIKPDTVYCSNVLEHIENEDVALQNIHQVLDDNGKLILIVPQGKFLFSSLDKSLGHFRRYSRTSLFDVLDANGYQIEKTLSFNKVGSVAWFWRGKIRRAKSLGKSNLKLFNILVPAIKILDSLLPWKGLSWLVVAKKKKIKDSSRH